MYSTLHVLSSWQECKFKDCCIFAAAQQPHSGLGRLIVEVSIDYTSLDTPGNTPLDEGSARLRDRYLHNTQKTQETNILSLVGIRIRDPSNQVVAHLRLTAHGYRNGQGFPYTP